MCGRYYFSADREADEQIAAMMRMMEKNYAGQYKTGEILPGDTAPGIIRRAGKIVPIPATFGFPGFSGKKLLLNARSETAGEKKRSCSGTKKNIAEEPSNAVQKRKRLESLL